MHSNTHIRNDTAGILTTDQKAAVAGAIAGVADAHISLTRAQVVKIVALHHPAQR